MLYSKQTHLKIHVHAQAGLLFPEIIPVQTVLSIELIYLGVHNSVFSFLCRSHLLKVYIKITVQFISA